MEVQESTEGLLGYLAGCIWQDEHIYPGLVKLIHAPEASLLTIVELPGVMHIEQPGDYRDGWHVPSGLFEAGQRAANLQDFPPDPIEATPSGILLEDHQRRSVTFIRQATPQRQGCILGAFAGAGKTIPTLQALWLDGYLHRSLLICGPLSSRETWCGPNSDAKRHFDMDVCPLVGTTPNERLLQEHQWFFIHYDIVGPWLSVLGRAFTAASLVVDESQDVCNFSAQRTKDVIALSKKSTIERRVLLSGTPIPKTRMDLWAQLAIAQPNQWSDTPHKFGVRHLDGKRLSHEEGQGHWVYEGESNTLELRARLAGVYLRYTDEVDSTIPKLKREVIDLSKDVDLTEYWTAQASGVKKKGPKKDKKPSETIKAGNLDISLDAPRIPDQPKTHYPAQLVSLTQLIVLLEKAKARASVSEIVKRTGQYEKLIVFCWMRETAKLIAQELKRYANQAYPADWIVGPVDGSIVEDKRVPYLRKFAELDRGVFVCTRGAFKTSRNELACASLAVQISPGWNPSENIQTEARIKRKGNSHAEVTALYFRVPGTVDDLFLSILEKKAKESRAMADADTQGLHLVADLSPQGLGDAGPDLDAIVAILAEMEEDNDEDE